MGKFNIEDFNSRFEQHYEHIEMDKLVRNALKGFKVDENGFVLGE
jgi:hypothetical protein